MRQPTSQRAPVVTRKPCPRCGADIDRFRNPETGLDVHLDTSPVPIDKDLTNPNVRRRLWEHRGTYVGWCKKFSPQRTWRELRLQHQCAHNTVGD